MIGVCQNILLLDVDCISSLIHREKPFTEVENASLLLEVFVPFYDIKLNSCLPLSRQHSALASLKYGVSGVRGPIRGGENQSVPII